MVKYSKLINTNDNTYNNDYLFRRSGTLTLRSNLCMQYDPRVLTDEWHEFRQSYPIDYDIKKPDNRDLLRSTYNSLWFGKKTDPLPKSATHEMMDQSFQWYRQRKSHQKLPPLTIDDIYQTGLIEKDIAKKYPRLERTFHLTDRKPIPSSVYTSDYKFPLHLRKFTEPVKTQIPELSWMKYRPFHSNFTDTDCACHKNIHIWQDEQCKYPHGRQKPEMPQKDPILHPEDPRLNKD